MHARSTTFRDRPAALESGIVLVRDEIMPGLLELPGCVGLSMLVDRGSGTCIVTTAWEDEQALRASAEPVGQLRRRAQQHFDARPGIHAWEIALLHRAQATGRDARARVTWMRLPRRLVDAHVEAFRTALLPRAEALTGFCSASLLVDRLTGRSALAVVYDSDEALAASREVAAGLRAEVARRVSGELLDVVELDVAIAHLRVPETVQSLGGRGGEPTCATGGCSRTRTVPHHAIPWWLSALTRLRDLVPLCTSCHHDLHEGHRTLRLHDGRLIDDHGWASTLIAAA